ncbi:MAG: rhodanese-like domain-containing protein [Gammaproteobacteria bacterium]
MFAQITDFSANNPLLVGAFVALLVALFFNEMKHATQKFRSLVPAEAVQKMNNEEVLFLDVREPAETASGKIAKAIQIPAGSVAERISELEKHRGKPVIVYCKTGTRSGIACRALSKGGFEKVFSLNGGLLAWQDAHLPVVKK